MNDFLEDYHRLLLDYVVCGNSHRFSLRFPSSAPKNIDFCACTKQRNGIDCGLAGGRKWKVRRATMMNELVIEAWKTKEGSPTSGDIIKSAAVLKGEVVPFAAAYRTLMQESQLSKKQATKGYELIISYLNKLTKTSQTP